MYRMKVLRKSLIGAQVRFGRAIKSLVDSGVAEKVGENLEKAGKVYGSTVILPGSFTLGGSAYLGGKGIQKFAKLGGEEAAQKVVSSNIAERLLRMDKYRN